MSSEQELEIVRIGKQLEKLANSQTPVRAGEGGDATSSVHNNVVCARVNVCWGQTCIEDVLLRVRNDGAASPSVLTLVAVEKACRNLGGGTFYLMHTFPQTTFDNGVLQLTTHRLIWDDNEQEVGAKACGS